MDATTIRLAHLADDYEKMRTSALRNLTDQNRLLIDGLHALRNGSPEVTDEFLDRAIRSIAAEIQRLRTS